MKPLPQHLSQSTVPQSTSEEDMKHNFTGMIMCIHAKITQHSWILDSGTTDHTTYAEDILSNKRLLYNKPKLTLPNGELSEIIHIGNVTLESGLILKNALLVPTFNYNLLSVPKLAKDNKCIIIFYPTLCII